MAALTSDRPRVSGFRGRARIGTSSPLEAAIGSSPALAFPWFVEYGRPNLFKGWERLEPRRENHESKADDGARGYGRRARTSGCPRSRVRWRRIRRRRRRWWRRFPRTWFFGRLWRRFGRRRRRMRRWRWLPGRRRWRWHGRRSWRRRWRRGTRHRRFLRLGVVQRGGVLQARRRRGGRALPDRPGWVRNRRKPRLVSRQGRAPS